MYRCSLRLTQPLSLALCERLHNFHHRFFRRDILTQLHEQHLWHTVSGSRHCQGALRIEELRLCLRELLLCGGPSSTRIARRQSWTVCARRGMPAH